MSATTKNTRRQRLDEEYQPLIAADSTEPLCFFGRSLITVIFNAQTIVDATLFFITGAHKSYIFTPCTEHPDVVDVSFSQPRIPHFFNHLLPDNVDDATHPPKKTRVATVKADEEPPTTSKHRAERARKRCAFFTVHVTRRSSTLEESPLVHLSADVKLFHYTAHVCGLRTARDAEIVMYFIHQAFVANQRLLDSDDAEVFTRLAGGDATRRAFLESNRKCCTIPLEVSQGDVVMTNICGRFPKCLNLRETYRAISTNYPGVLSYLTTMSKSNYLAVTLFEDAPFVPILSRVVMSTAAAEEVDQARLAYLISSKKSRSKMRKHTFFIYASGRFIQSSRNNVTALLFSAHCMRLLHAVSEGIESPAIVEEESSSAASSAPEVEE